MPTANLTSSPIINSILSAAMLGLMGWTLLTVHNLSNDLGVINATVQFAIQDRYTSTEAKADNLVLKQQIRVLEEKIDSLKLRLNEVEDDIRKDR